MLFLTYQKLCRQNVLLFLSNRFKKKGNKLEKWKLSIATSNNAVRAFLLAPLFPHWTFLLQAWWGCYHCLLSFTVDPMTCSVPISDVVLPRQPIVKKIHAQARTKSTAASLAKRLNSVCTISSKWLNLNYWLRFCINQLSRAFLCREQTLSAWTILQIRDAVFCSCGNRYKEGTKACSPLHGFQVLFSRTAGIQKSCRQKLWSGFMCLMLSQRGRVSSPCCQIPARDPNKVIWWKGLMLCTGSWQFSPQLLFIGKLCWSAKW